MKVPFVDLNAQYLSIKGEIDKAISTVISECSFVGGEHVARFEKEFAEAYGVKNCISAGNGTDTIYIILKMLGIGTGDEVITVANSWISSSETITQTGARVTFVDIDPDFYSIDENAIANKITSKTKALIVVHLQGQSCDMDKIQSICDKNGIYLIEDCAQAHFTKYKDKLVGTFGIAASFSFYPGKNLGAYGDAGCIITNDDELAKRMRMYARHGALVKHQHQIEGINSRMDGLQAAILTVKLKYMLQWTNKRIFWADQYNKGLSGIDQIVLPKVKPDTVHTYHLYVIRVAQRDKLKEYLHERGIETAIHYPTPLPFLPAYSYLKHTPEDFPVAYNTKKEILSLPMFPELTNDQVEFVISSIKEFYQK